MTTTLIRNIGLLVTGILGDDDIADTTLVVRDGLIEEVGGDVAKPDQIVDARGLSVIPGLVDGHVHPTFGDWSPAQDTIGWCVNYVQGGTTTMISAGELHVPGLPLSTLTPEIAIALAITTKNSTGNLRPGGVKLHCGTLLLLAGMSESDFDRLVEAGIGLLKFIFYDWSRLDSGEAEQYVAWAHARGMLVKLHSGGVSRSGVSATAGHSVICRVRPDIIAHVSGGPIPMPDEEIIAVIDDVDAFVEVCSSMNYRATTVAVGHLAERGELHRLVLGTDTPGGTGIIPRGMLRNLCFLSSICEIDPTDAIAAATGNTASAHGLSGGILAPGFPADFILLGPIQGSRAETVLDCLSLGDLPGISMVYCDGERVVGPRSSQTPPPRVLAVDV